MNNPAAPTMPTPGPKPMPTPTPAPQDTLASHADTRQVGGDHYKKLSPQPWDVMRSWVPKHLKPFEAFLWCSALKYVARAGRKTHIYIDTQPNADPNSTIRVRTREDVEKAIHYLQKLAQELNRA